MTAPRLIAAATAALVAVALAVGLTAPAAPRATPLPAPSGPLRLPPHAAAIVADAETGRVLWQRRAHRPLLAGSTAKLMTALLTLEELPLEETIAAPPYAGGPDESLVGLGTGERMRVLDLLRGLLVASGNDAAVALAVGAAGSTDAFVARMNERAEELGMSDTRYGNPIGLDAGTRTSAADLVTLTRELRRHDAFREIVAAPVVALESGAFRRVLRNSNDLLGGRLGVDGVKTGHTEAAGYALVGSAAKGDRAVISVVLGAPSEADRDRATLRLVRVGLRRAR